MFTVILMQGLVPGAMSPLLKKAIGGIGALSLINHEDEQPQRIKEESYVNFGKAKILETTRRYRGRNYN